VIVRHADDRDLLDAALGDRDANTHETVGGATRQASVFEGLRYLSTLSAPPAHVLIHDAARPFVSYDLLERLAASLRSDPELGVIPAIPIAETIKAANESALIDRTVPRDGLYRAQTPQGFPFSAILEVHENAATATDVEFTDDASLYEWARLPVRIVRGDSHNVKLTYTQDFEDAEVMLNGAAMKTPDVRVGHGYDTHQLVRGHGITLCGVTIPHDRKLSGHSDADVGLHALTDALLATTGAGDIGSHFPPSDPQWKGASSDRFLRHAADLVRASGGTITHCDVTLVCEEPKIGPHRNAMKEAIAGILDLDAARISVKATTNERIGFIGRQEGMAALATATVLLGGQ
jgi:2-C-methyl-D-erythritol 4-phosphate cytidylyltransferase/2-C-methyl-D-erythritol 2,4-cyclodiphosphate synthase